MVDRSSIVVTGAGLSSPSSSPGVRMWTLISAYLIPSDSPRCRPLGSINALDMIMTHCRSVKARATA